PLVSGIALSMSPMTAAIMSAVPTRRAGAGSAMNDASRELGAALGVAVLGSVAASRYRSHIKPLLSGLPAGQRARASSSISGALDTAAHARGSFGARLADGASHAFVSGIHFAVYAGAMLCAIAAVVVYKYLPRQLAQEGAVASPTAALEE